MQQTENANSSPLVLGRAITVNHVNELTKSMLSHIRQPETETLCIDISNIEEIDTAGLQLLISAKNHAKSIGRELRFLGNPIALHEWCDRAGIRFDLLDQPTKASL